MCIEHLIFATRTYWWTRPLWWRRFRPATTQWLFFLLFHCDRTMYVPSACQYRNDIVISFFASIFDDYFIFFFLQILRKHCTLPWDSIFWAWHIFTLIITIFVASVIITEKTICIWRLIAVALMIFRKQRINAKGFFCWNIRLICRYWISKTLLIANTIWHKTITFGRRWHCTRWYRRRWHWVGILWDDWMCFQIMCDWFWRMHVTWS